MLTKIFEMLIPRHWCTKVLCTHSHKTAALEPYKFTGTQKLNWFCEAVCIGEVDPLLNCCTNEIT